MIDIGKRLRAARQKQKLSLRDLAAKADVSASLLSQIENHRSNPSVNTLYRIAAVLGVPMDYFFPDSDTGETASEMEAAINKTASEVRQERIEQTTDTGQAHFEGEPATPAVSIMHSSARPTIELQGGVTWSRLTHHAEAGTEFLEITYHVDAESGSAMSRHSGREFGLVLEGTLTLELAFEEHELGPGDSIIFDSETPHRLSNRGKEPVRAVWVVLERQY